MIQKSERSSHVARCHLIGKAGHKDHLHGEQTQYNSPRYFFGILYAVVGNPRMLLMIHPYQVDVRSHDLNLYRDAAAYSGWDSTNKTAMGTILTNVFA